MSTTVRDFLDRVLTSVNDPEAESWYAPELVQYINEGLNTLALARPEQFTVVETVSLAAGTKQVLPAGALKFLRLNRSINSDDTPLAAVREVSLRALEQHYPEWHGSDAGPVQEWAPDPSDPTTFWVSPPAVAANKVEAEYVKKPTHVDVGSEIPTDPAYDAALMEFVLYRAYSKDAEYAGQDNRAQAHYMKFKELIGGTDQQPS